MRPLDTSITAAIGPHTSAPSPADQSMSVATTRNRFIARVAGNRRRKAHRPHASGGLGCGVRRHLERPAERHGDILTVHERIDERLPVGGAGVRAMRTDRRADLGDELVGGEPGGAVAGPLADHPMRVAAVLDEVGQRLPPGGLLQSQMSGHVTYGPAVAQRGVAPLLVRAAGRAGRTRAAAGRRWRPRSDRRSAVVSWFHLHSGWTERGHG